MKAQLRRPNRWLLVSLFMLLPGLEPTFAWQSTPGAAGVNGDAANALALDANGNVIAGGVISNRFTVAKLAGTTGEELWRATVTDPNFSFFGVAAAVGVDSRGDIVAVGALTTPYQQAELFIVKLDGASGKEQWRYVIYSLDAFATAVAFDKAGNVVVGGRVYINDGAFAFFVIKLAGLDGSKLWSRSITGGQGETEVNGLTIDTAGDVIAAGAISNDARNADLYVTKLSGVTGAVMWIYRTYTAGFESDFNYVQSVALDPRDDVVVAGWTKKPFTSTGEDVFVAKLSNETGVELWSRQIDGGSSHDDYAWSVAVDSAGNGVVAGTFGMNQDSRARFFVLKVAGESGAELWRHIVEGSARHSDQARAVSLDAADNVFVVGLTQNVETDQDITTVKLARSTGDELWRSDVSGTALSSSDDFARLLAVDSCQNVVVAGITQNVRADTSPRFNGDTFTVLKLSGLSGESSREFKAGHCTRPHASIFSQGSVDCTSPSGGVVTLDGTESNDADSSAGTNDDIIGFEWFEDYGEATQRPLGTGARLAVTLPLGAHVLSLKVVDGEGMIDVAHATVTVVDNTPPELTCPTVSPNECFTPGGSQVSLAAAASDACSPTVKVANSRSSGGADASGFFALGITPVTFTATDAAGNVASCTVPVTVQDTTPPQLTLALSPRVLWPPNHRMVLVQAAWQVTDVCDPSAGVVLASAASSEPADAAGGEIQNASFGSPDVTVLLRADRSSDGPGRVYTLTYVARDKSGNTASAHQIVTVPHDMDPARGQ